MALAARYGNAPLEFGRTSSARSPLSGSRFAWSETAVGADERPTPLRRLRFDPPKGEPRELAVALAVMAQLASTYDQTVYLTVSHRHEAICLERIDSGAAIRVMTLEVGGSQPLHLGAGPRALLAYREKELFGAVLEAGLKAETANSIIDVEALRENLERIRRDGYALSLEDMTIGVGAVGAPVFDRSGAAIASISAAGLIARYTPRPTRTSPPVWCARARACRGGWATSRADWGSPPAARGSSRSGQTPDVGTQAIVKSTRLCRKASSSESVVD